ncbi:MAG: Gmad2 immunoglobulin-like domain-containing protein [Microthrixaceae bacterium]
MNRRRSVSIAVLACALLLAVGCGGEDEADEPGDAGSSSTTESTEATASTDDSASSTVPDEVDTLVVWPPTGSSTTYLDPVDAATAFAVELVGFIEPVVGEFAELDEVSGEVGVRSWAEGPATTVQLRRLAGAETWSVTGSTTAEILPTSPASGAEISSPVQLEGTSTAFEGTVQVSVRDADAQPLGAGFVTGGSMGDMGPFAESLGFDEPATSSGSIAFYTLSMEDGGGVIAATVVPVRFAS